MGTAVHERPGVYSAYDLSAAIWRRGGGKTVGLAARAAQGEAGKAVMLTSYEEGVSRFGETSAMTVLLHVLFANGASAVAAVAVENEDYEAAFAALEQENVAIVVCDSDELSVQQSLRESVKRASAERKERIAVVGSSGETPVQLVERAKALDCERVVLVGGNALNEAGEELGSIYAAAAVAGALSRSGDSALPLNGEELEGLGGLAERYSDNEIDLLVRGGVLPLETVNGRVSVVRGITTRTTTGGAADATWRELTTVCIVDDVITTVRSALHSRFMRKKNTVQTRGAIRSQVIMELERKRGEEIIDSYGDVTVSVDGGDPTVCLVEFSFAVTHGLNRIYLTAHITV